MDRDSTAQTAAAPSASLDQAACDLLEVEITTLWGHITAATHRFLELVAAFDRAGGWARQGFPSCAHWLNLNCGIGMVAAREKVRVAAALQALPKISDAFASGQISYSKVRAIARVATPEMQDTLLNIARYGTASHVERVARDFRNVERVEAAQLAEARHRERYLRFVHDDDGSLSIYARLPPEVGAIVRKAIEAAVAVVDEAGMTASNGSAGKAASDGGAGMAVSDGGAGMAVSDGGAGMAASNSSVVAVAEPVPSAWHDSAESSEYAELDDSIGARRSDALRLLAEHFLRHEADRCPSSTDRFQVVVHIDQQLLCGGTEDSGDGSAERYARSAHGVESLGERGRSSSQQLVRAARGRSEIEDGPGLAVETARRLACDSSLIGVVENGNGEPLNVGRKTRAISPALKRALAARDGCCRFPGCDRNRFTEGHHVTHWANGGETSLANLITLCRFHHRLIHEGGFGLRATDDGVFVFTDPDGKRLEEYRTTARRFRGVELAAVNAQRGVTPIRPPGWHGERLDRSMAVEAMLWEKEVGMT